MKNRLTIWIWSKAKRINYNIIQTRNYDACAIEDILGECFMGLLAMDILGNVLMHVGGTYDELCWKELEICIARLIRGSRYQRKGSVEDVLVGVGNGMSSNSCLGEYIGNRMT